MRLIKSSNLNRGLVGAWCPSVAGEGLILPDLSGRGNHGTLTNMDASDWVGSTAGRALDFDGSNDFVGWDNISSRYYTLPFTVSAWALSRNDTANNSIFTFGNTTTTTQLFAVYFRGDLVGDPIIAQMRGNNDAINTGATSPEGFVTNRWYHVVAVFRSTTYRQIYVDSIAGTADTTSHTVEPLNTMTIGALRRPTNVAFLDGQVNDVRVYNRELSPSEIKQLYEGGPGFGLRQERKRSRFVIQQQFNAGRFRRQQLIGTGVY